MDDRDLRIRNATYGAFVALGHAPSAEHVAGEVGATTAEIEAAWRRLHDAHALVLHRDRPEIRMANPFSAAPTAHRVLADDRWWYANCAWDAFGVLAALHTDGRIESSCPDCREPLTIAVEGGRPDDTSPLFHCLVPASSWWEDIGFT